MQMLLAWIQAHKSAVYAALSAIILTGGCIAGILMHQKPAPAEETVATTTAQTTVMTTPATTVTTTTTLPPTTKTTTTKRKTTTKKTTRRTVKPPPIVVEPDNVKDDGATPPKNDSSMTPPATNKDITVDFVRNEFGGKGNFVGIDISRHNGEIDWTKVKKNGVDFAIIRCGYRTTVGGLVYEDANFKKNIQGAIAAGVPVGIYFFSAAKNEYEALEEAAFVIEVLKPYKDKVTWPVAFDFEIFDSDRVQGVDDTTLTDNAIAFMDTVAAAGYTPMVYSSRNMLWHQFETARLSAYRVWMAHYVNTYNQKRYNGDHAIWQCASDGKVDGIAGRVDMNVAYSDLSKVSSPLLPAKDPADFANIFNGFTFTEVYEEVEVTADGLNVRISPFTDRPNKWATLTKGVKVVRTGIDNTKGWSRLTLNGVTVYASNDYLKFIRVTNRTTTTTTTTTTTPTTTTTVAEKTTTSITTTNINE